MKLDKIKTLREKKIQVFSRLRLRNIFSGEWESVYRGEGIEFADIKPFEPGDNPRDIDFSALVQSGEELVVERVETRQLRVYACADYSGSLQQFQEMLFPQKPLIRDIAVGLVLWGAVNIYSPLGFYPFGLTKNKFFPPMIGEKYCWEILNWLADEENLRLYTSSGVENVLKSLPQLAQSRNMVFLISDFKQKVFENDFTDILKRTIGNFDFIPVIIRDPLEKNGKINFSVRIKVQSSSQSGKMEEIRFTPDALRKIQEVSNEHLLNLEDNFKKLNIEYLVLDSASIDDCCRSFSHFFQTRKKARH